MRENLEKSFDYYLSNKKEILSKYNGKWIVIKDSNIINSYDDEIEAIDKSITEGLKRGEFIVQLVSENDGTKAHFVSNVYA